MSRPQYIRPPLSERGGPELEPASGPNASANGAAQPPKEAVGFREVTPALAAKWLEKNHEDNRGIDWKRVDGFAGDMIAGAWRTTHQGIAFDDQGRLVDGQHRLWAIARAKVSVRLLVTYGVSQLGDPLDCGRPRSIATLSGLGSKVIAGVNALRMLEQGVNLNSTMTLHEAREVYDHHEAALAQVLASASARNRLVGGALGAVVWAWPLGPERVAEFVKKFFTGEMIQRGDPVYAFRSWITTRSNVRLGTWPIAMATCNCLRYHLAEETLASVFTGEMGYRHLTAKRRAKNLPWTPGADLVAIAPSLDTRAR